MPLLGTRQTAAFLIGLGVALGPLAHDTVAQDQNGRGLLGRPSPPQPQQKPGLEYFVGTWTFTWSGRESALTPGPRAGTATFALAGSATPQLRLEVKGTIDGGGAYQESGTATWDEEKKQLSLRERLSGIDIISMGDWRSPIAINVDSQPVTVKGQSVKLRRFYSILSATSFSVVEELSTAGEPFVRIGKGDFVKQA